MWFFIFGAMALVSGASVIYIISRLYRFAYTKKIGGERKPVRILAALLPAVCFCVVVYFSIGLINTAVVLMHMAIIWLLCDIVNAIVKKKRGVESRRYYAGAVALIFGIGYLAAGWYLANNVWRTGYELTTEKAVGDLRIVQIADSHVGTTFDGDGFAEHMRRIQNEEPDVVVVTGDFVDDDTDREDMIKACRALGGIQTKYGVYYAFGNHDKGYYGAAYRGYSGDDLVAELEKNGVTVLMDTSVLIDNRFYIIGRKDRSEEARGGARMEMDELVRGLDTEKYMIVLDHQPHDYDAQERAGVDLVLSGHTHAGQLIPINYVGEWTGENEQTYGREKRGNTDFIVTSGISAWAIRFKTGCRSEYVVVDVRGKKGAA